MEDAKSHTHTYRIDLEPTVSAMFNKVVGVGMVGGLITSGAAN